MKKGLCCIMLMLTACSTAAPVEIVIPDMLTDRVAVPSWKGTTNGDIIGYIIDLRAVIERCNADREAVRKLISREASL